MHAMNFIVPACPHAFPLDLERTALLVIDVQNDFCHPDGFCLHDLGLDAAIRSVVEPIQHVVSWAREREILVIWTIEAHEPDLSDLPPSKAYRYKNAGYPVGSVGKRGKFLIRGEWGAQVLAELSPRAEETVLFKPAQSIFCDTDLEAQLRAQGITHLLICGLTTQCCVLATYRAANDLGFFSLLLEDCCAAFDENEHQAAIAVITSESGAVGWAAQSHNLIATTFL